MVHSLCRIANVKPKFCTTYGDPAVPVGFSFTFPEVDNSLFCPRKK